MRKLILIIALLVVPLGIWTAGCRNDNRQAAFPKTSEMKALAKSAESAHPTTPPVISAKPIDREILNLPERDAVARVQAVNDRSRQMTDGPDGLFSLPEERNYVASAHPAPTYSPAEIQAAPNAITPVPSAREFWSRPVKARPAGRQPVNVPAGVSAMVGPADDQLLPPASYMPPNIPGGRQFLPPDDLPGVFMEHDGAVLPDAPPPASGWIGKRNDKGGAPSASPLSSANATPKFRERTQARTGGRTAETMQKEPLKLDLDVLLGPPARTESPVDFASSSSMNALSDAPLVSGIGLGSFEPLPEPMPIEEYRAMKERESQSPAAERSQKRRADTSTARQNGFTDFVPMPSLIAASSKSKPVDMPASVPESRRKNASGGSEAALSALAPLPDITAPSRMPVDNSAVLANQISWPAPMPEPLLTPEMAAARESLLDFAPEATPASGKKSPAMPMLPELNEPVAKPSAPPIVEMPEPDLAVGSFFESLEKKAAPRAEPQKVKLQPMRSTHIRAIPELEEIDSATEVPPLKF